MHRVKTDHLDDQVDINLYYASEAIKYVRKVLPHGSVNKKSDESNPDHLLNIDQLAEARTEASQLSNDSDDNVLDRVNKLADIYEEHGVGNCYEQTIVALRFLKRLSVDDVDACQIPESNHWFLIIGGNIICDPWDNAIYPVSEFKKHQDDCYKADYADFVYAVFAEEGRVPVPFLLGTPRSVVVTNQNNKPAIINGQFIRGENVSSSTNSVSKHSLFCISNAEARTNKPRSDEISEEQSSSEVAQSGIRVSVGDACLYVKRNKFKTMFGEATYGLYTSQNGQKIDTTETIITKKELDEIIEANERGILSLIKKLKKEKKGSALYLNAMILQEEYKKERQAEKGEKKWKKYWPFRRGSLD